MGVLTTVYGVDRTEALAIALVDRTISVLSVIVVGGIAYVFSSKTKAGRYRAGLGSEQAGG